MKIDNHEEQLAFDIVQLGRHEIILGKPWLQRHNPTIDWQRDQISMDQCRCSRKQHPGGKEQDTPKELSATTLKQIKKTIQQDQVPTGYLWITLEANELATELEVPEEYAEFKELFEEKEPENVLLKYQL